MMTESCIDNNNKIVDQWSHDDNVMPKLMPPITAESFMINGNDDASVVSGTTTALELARFLSLETSIVDTNGERDHNVDQQHSNSSSLESIIVSPNDNEENFNATSADDDVNGVNGVDDNDGLRFISFL